MKRILVLAILAMASNSDAQNRVVQGDFLEIVFFNGFRASNIWVDPSTGRSLKEDYKGLTNYGAGLRLGKSFSPWGHLVVSAQVSKRHEIEVVDDLLLPGILVPINHIEIERLGYLFELGPRITLLRRERFALAVESGGFCRVSPKAESRFVPGYYANVNFAIGIRKAINSNVRIGYEESPTGYFPSSFPVEVAFQYCL